MQGLAQARRGNESAMLRKLLWTGLYASIGAGATMAARRAKGEAPTNPRPGSGTAAPSGPQLGSRPTERSGPNPLVVAAAALAVGVLLAKLIDWRGHAHPRD